jgi:hypothetical protein
MKVEKAARKKDRRLEEKQRNKMQNGKRNRRLLLFPLFYKFLNKLSLMVTQ